MMRKILAILLALSLLLSLAACGKTAEPDPAPEAVEPQPEPEPEPEPEPADPRALWDESEARLDACSSVEITEDSEFTYDFSSGTQTVKSTARFSGMDMDSRLAKCQLISSGDLVWELYYNNGTVYREKDGQQLRCMMSYEAFLDYAFQESPLQQDQFDCVELLSEENGYEIAFSSPRDSFVQFFEEEIVPSDISMKEGTLEVQGTVTLDAEGNRTGEDYAYICTAIYGDGQEVPIRLAYHVTYAHVNEELTLVFPEKLNNFVRVDDLEVIDALFDAAADLTQHYAADTLEQFTFEGEMAGVPVSLTKDYADGYTLDPDTQALRTHTDISLYIAADGEEETLTYTYDFADGTITYSGSDGTSGSEALDPTDELVATLADLQAFLSKDQFYLFENLTASEENGTLTLSFRASNDLVFQLFYYMLTMTAPDAAASLYECTDYLPGERSGAIVIDQETGQFQSLTTEVSAEFTMPDGSSYSGTIRFEKTFRAFDGDVSLPLPDGGAAA